MSSLVDLPSEDELKIIEASKVKKSVDLASSASENESANELKKKKKV